MKRAEAVGLAALKRCAEIAFGDSFVLWLVLFRFDELLKAEFSENRHDADARLWVLLDDEVLDVLESDEVVRQRLSFVVAHFSEEDVFCVQENRNRG